MQGAPCYRHGKRVRAGEHGSRHSVFARDLNKIVSEVISFIWSLAYGFSLIGLASDAQMHPAPFQSKPRPWSRRVRMAVGWRCPQFLERNHGPSSRFSVRAPGVLVGRHADTPGYLAAAGSIRRSVLCTPVCSVCRAGCIVCFAFGK